MRAAILAGGAASRFDGKPKGLEKVGGDRILDHIVQAIRAATGETPVIVANTENAKHWVDGCDVIPDVRTECGSLSGIHAAVAHDDSPVLVVAWDMPFVTVDLLESLIKGSEGVDACVPHGEDRAGLEPVCAVYGPGCLPHIEQQLDDEDYRASGFVEHVNTKILSREELEIFGDPEVLFFNVNTQADLEKAEELWRTRPE